MTFRPPRLLRAAILCALVGGMVLFSAVQTECQERSAFRVTLGGYLALASVDAGMTARCLSAGWCYEKNPIFGQRPARVVATKLALNTAMTAAIWRLHAKHPRTAWIAAVGMVAVQGAVVGMNVRTIRRMR